MPTKKEKSSPKKKTRRASAWPKDLAQTGHGAAEPDTLHDFFVVAIGASAGGLEAFKEFLSEIPRNSGMAIVFIQHLSPDHRSLLPEILSRWTPIPVKQVREGTKLKANYLYVIPPASTMFIKNGVFRLKVRQPEERPHHPIDRFMESLAYDFGSRAIGVVLSGTGSDGAEGIRIIKAEGGLSFAQTPQSARYDSMPSKAILIDDIDFVLDPKALALEITGLSEMPMVRKVKSLDQFVRSEDEEFSKILLMLKETTGTDFSQYKPATFHRRMTRRMLLHKIDSVSKYFKFLQENPLERVALGQDVLINVTSFFREAEAYDYLRDTVIPTVIKNKPAGAPLRIWSAGCSTGEETYTIAICVFEALGAEATATAVQIFGTDLSDKCIDKARLGIFLDNISEHVSEERLKKHFRKVEGGYRIGKHLRDLCIFAKHDLTRDPVYSKLDIIVCKNLLIYLGQDLQNKILENFHHSLNPDGVICLGNSESLGAASDLYTVVEPKLKVFAKKSITSKPTGARFDYRLPTAAGTTGLRHQDIVSPSSYEIQMESDRAILSRYSPACVVINHKLEILQFRGNTEPFLSHKHGVATLNLLKLVRTGLVSELKKAVRKSHEKDIPVRTVDLAGPTGPMNIEIIPLKFLPGPRCFLVVFEVQPPEVTALRLPRKKGIRPEVTIESSLIEQLRQELTFAKENLQSVVSDFEKANQELQSANEEVLSSNEELQSTNEELETSKEELQSANEELSTLNDELQDRNRDLFRVNNDLVNILNSVQVPVIIVGNDLTLRRFTPGATKIFNLIPTDIGRPFSHVSSEVVNTRSMEPMIQEVLDSATVQETQIEGSQGNWYTLRVRPYKTEENRIEGAVLTLQESPDLTQVSKFTEVVLDLVRAPLAVFGPGPKFLCANKEFYEIFKVKPEVNWGGPQFATMLEAVFTTKKEHVTESLTSDFPKIGRRSFKLTFRKLNDGKLQNIRILVCLEEES